MAIAFDAASSGDSGSASSLTISHTVSGNNTALVVFVENVSTGAVNTNTSVTYNGVALTQSQTIAIADENVRDDVWYLLNPATGTHNIVITSSGTSNTITGIGLSYTGVQQTRIGTSAQNSGNSTTPSITMVTTGGNSFFVGCTRTNNRNPAIDSPATERAEVLNSQSHYFNAGDRTTTTTASYSVSWTAAGAASVWETLGIELIESGAIAFIRAGHNTAYSTSFSFDCTGANALFLAIATDGGNDPVSAATYNSVSMTQLVKQQGDATNHYVYIYGLLNPSSGSNTISVTSSNGNLYLSAACFSGVGSISDATASNYSAGASSPYTGTITTVANNAMAVLFARTFSGATQTASTNSNEATFEYASIKLYYGGPKTPAGSFGQSITFTGTSDTVSVQASFAPTGTGPTNISSWNGVTAANISTYNGVSWANIDTLNGVT